MKQHCQLSTTLKSVIHLDRLISNVKTSITLEKNRITPMSGHNRWSQIKHKKAKEDSKRGKTFTKLIKEITMSARDGGGDPASNAHLRTLLEKAREVNMPLDNSMRAIKRGIGELPGVSYESYTYEGYGPSGIAVIVEVLSDNKNRTVADLRHLFSSKGGTLADSGAVGWMFEHAGVVRLTSAKLLSEDVLLEHLLDYNIMDIKSDDDTTFSVVCDPKSLDQVKQALLTIPGIKIESAELEWVAKNPMNLSEEATEQSLDFLSALQDHDDVKNVYTNLA